MKSKKLRSNFTTPEQSKRLLEIGVPTWTADCYYNEYGKMEIKNTALDILYTPCWSVGRLIEVLAITMDSDVIDFDTYANSPCVLKELLEKYEENRDLLNFAKLELD